MRLSEVQQRALREVAVAGSRGITCSNLGSALATTRRKRLPQTYARQGGKTLHALEGRGMVACYYGGGHWNWILTKRGYDELARSSHVEGVFEAMVNLPKSWRCSGRCGEVRRESANKLMDEQWTFTSIGLANWGKCPRCPRSGHPDMAGAARQMFGGRR